jgi:hypothetical protein
LAAILKMVPNWFPTLKNFYWSPQYRTNSTLSDFNEISYVGRLWCPKLIPDIDKFLPVSIFKSHFENGRHLENFDNAELLL